MSGAEEGAEELAGKGTDDAGSTGVGDVGNADGAASGNVSVPPAAVSALTAGRAAGLADGAGAAGRPIAGPGERFALGAVRVAVGVGRGVVVRVGAAVWAGRGVAVGDGIGLGVRVGITRGATGVAPSLSTGP